MSIATGLESILQEIGSRDKYTGSPVIKLNDDLVALSIASYKIGQRTLPATRWTDLAEVSATADDHAEAAALRKYYGHKFTMDALHGKNRSQFRQKMAAFLMGQHEILKSELGMVYRLPYFYAEDQAIDRVIESTVAVDVANRVIKNISAKFTLDQVVFRSRRAGDSYQYWLRSNQNLYPYMIAVKSDNPLRSMLASALQKPVDLTCMALPKSFHSVNRHYWQLSNVELV
jgi:hypothetical protein